MHAKVNQDTCVGCNLCVDSCPAVFKMDGSVAVVITDEVPAPEQKACREAAESCPVEAILIED